MEELPIYSYISLLFEEALLFKHIDNVHVELIAAADKSICYVYYKDTKIHNDTVRHNDNILRQVLIIVKMVASQIEDILIQEQDELLQDIGSTKMFNGKYKWNKKD